MPSEKQVRRYKPGQMTWPEDGATRNCTACREWVPQPRSKKGKGHCARAARIYRKKMASYIGSEAFACRYFLEG